MVSGHAFVAQGGHESLSALLSLLKEEGVETVGNPDFYTRTYGSFTIDNARELAARAAMHGLKGPRVFVLAVDTINAEAQHALLKTLEEPPGSARLFFLHPSPDTLLPTIRSRVQILALPGITHTSAVVDVASFLKAAPAKRLDMLKPLLENPVKDEQSSSYGAGRRDMGEILLFLSALERALGPTQREALHAVYRARRYSDDRGALVKPLLEQVALLV